MSLGYDIRVERLLNVIHAVLSSNTSINAAIFNTVDGDPSADPSFWKFFIRLFMDRNEYDLYMRYVNMLLTPTYSTIGWIGNETDWNTSVLRLILFPYAILFDIGDSRAQAVNFFNQLVSNCTGQTANFASCNPLSPDIRQAVYCGAVLNESNNIYAQTKNFVLDAWANSRYFTREEESLEFGLTCTQDPNNVKDLVYFFINNSHAHALRNFEFNNKISDTLYSILLNDSQTIINANALDPFLYGMTGLWYTSARLRQIQTINATLSTSVGVTNSTKDILNFYVNKVSNANQRGELFYYKTTRWVYDTHVNIGQTPWKLRLPMNQIADNYAVHVFPYIPSSYASPPGREFTFDGTNRMVLNLTQNTSTLSLSTHRHIITSVLVQDVNNNSIPILEFVRDYDNAMMVIKLGQFLNVGTSVTVTIDYVGFIFNQPQAGVMANYEFLEVNGQRSWIFATQFENGPGTRSLAPCLDEPGYKAKWKITLYHPSDLIALGNMLEETVMKKFQNRVFSSHPVFPGLTRTVFRQTPPMSSYLIALSMGDYAAIRAVTKVDKVLVRLWTWNGMQNYGAQALQYAVDTLDYLSSYMNQSYVLSKLDIVALPQFTGRSIGAMENWGLILGGYNDFLWHPDYSDTEALATVQETTSHETTHQWFGDLISPAWWQYLFLNEGFASYWYIDVIASYYPQQKSYSEYRWFSTSETAMTEEESFGGLLPTIPDPLNIGSGPEGLFSEAVYPKAAAIFEMLSHTIRNTSFQAALQQYFRWNQYTAVTDETLWGYMSQAAANAGIPDWNLDGPLNVSAFMRPFTYQSLYPMIKVVTSPDGYTYTYQQAPFLKNLTVNQTNAFNQLWPIPIFTLTPNRNDDSYQWLTTQNGWLSTPNTDPWKVTNPRRRAFARVWYDDLSWSPIFNQILANASVFDARTRAQFLADTYALVRTDRVSWKRLLNLTLYLSQETDYIPWRYFIPIENLLSTNYKFQPEYTQIQKHITNLLRNQTAVIQRNGTWTNDLFAKYTSEKLCSLGDTNCRTLMTSSFQNFVTQCQNSVYGTGKCNPVAPDFRGTQFCYGLLQNWTNAFVLENLIGVAKSSLESFYFPQDYNAMLYGLSCVGDSSLLERYIQFALQDYFSPNFFDYVTINDPSGTKLYNFFTKYTADVVKSINFSRYVLAMVRGWSTDTQLAQLNSFNWQGLTLNSNQNSAWNAALTSVVQTKNWLNKYGKDISDWLTVNIQ